MRRGRSGNRAPFLFLCARRRRPRASSGSKLIAHKQDRRGAGASCVAVPHGSSKRRCSYGVAAARAAGLTAIGVLRASLALSRA